MRVLVAGMGNVLRGDDGFGVAVAEHLSADPLPREVEVIDVGIGGIHLVQKLMDERFDCLFLLDAIQTGSQPGTVAVIDPDVVDVTALPLRDRHDRLADVHYAEPGMAMMLASALGVLPPTVRVVGCQPEDDDEPRRGLSPPIQAAVAVAAFEVRRLAREMGVAWDPISGVSES